MSKFMKKDWEEKRRMWKNGALRGKLLFLTAAAPLLFGGCGESAQDHIAEGYAALGRQEYTQAQEQFEQALLDGEDRELAYRGIGLEYMGQGEYAMAIGAFRQALEEASVFPGDLEYDINYYMAICYYKQGEYDAAVACYDAIIDLQGKSADAYYMRGNMRLYLGDVEGAVADFDAAVSAGRGNDYGLYLDIYEVMLQHHADVEAQNYLDVVMSVSAKDITEYDKGRLCYYRGEYNQACVYLERARGEGDVDSDVIRLLGECYKLQGQYNYAAVVYSGYVDQYADAQICNQMGMCYVEQGDYENALAAFERGIAIEENNNCMQTLKHNRIVCYEYLGDYATAATYLAEYLDAYGSDPFSEKEYAFLITR